MERNPGPCEQPSPWGKHPCDSHSWWLRAVHAGSQFSDGSNPQAGAESPMVPDRPGGAPGVWGSVVSALATYPRAFLSSGRGPGLLLGGM